MTRRELLYRPCAAALLAGALLASAASPAAAARQKEILGWVEWVDVGRPGLRLKAKLDTGAAISSLDAQEIRRLVRPSTGERFVEFTVFDPETQESLRLKKPLVRRIRIKQHDGAYQVRPVVAMEVCVADRRETVEVSLIDRSGFLYPVLLGRSALEGKVVVDPELTFTRRPACRRAPERRKGAAPPTRKGSD